MRKSETEKNNHPLIISHLRFRREQVSSVKSGSVHSSAAARRAFARELLNWFLLIFSLILAIFSSLWAFRLSAFSFCFRYFQILSSLLSSESLLLFESLALSPRLILLFFLVDALEPLTVLLLRLCDCIGVSSAASSLDDSDELAGKLSTAAVGSDDGWLKRWEQLKKDGCLKKVRTIKKNGW